MRKPILTLPVLFILLACGPMNGPGAESDPSPPTVPAIDSVRIRSADEAAAWGFQRDLMADLDGDGSAERLVIAADAEVRPDGAALWEDGHRWAVYVESATGERTLLYAAFVPNGSADGAVVAASDDDGPGVLILERTPSRVRVFEVEYLGPDRTRVRAAASHLIEAWLPGSASLP